MAKSQVEHGKFKMRFKLAQITDFVTANHKDDVKAKADLNVLPLDMYITRCPRCGSTKVIKKGYETRKRKRDSIQRWACKECGPRFIDDPTAGSHFPIWVADRVLDLAAKGHKPKEIVEEVKRESRLLDQSVTMSVQSVPNLVKRYVKMLLLFEQLMSRKEALSEWQIDDSPQGFSGKKDFLWITNVLEVKNRYWLSAHVSFNRRIEESENAFKLALKRAKYLPQRVKCDGWKPHIQGAGKCLRHVPILSKTKKQDYGWINLIERLHRSMRGLAIKKRRRFRSLGALQNLVDLVRIYYNFLRPHQTLDGCTPAMSAGIVYPHDGWSNLIRYAHKVIKKYEVHFH